MPYTTYLLLALFVILFLWFAYHIKHNPLADPLDLVTSPVNGRMSAAKIGQLVGLIVATWVVVYMTSHDTLSFDIFGVYLAYVAGVDAYSKYLRKDAANPGKTTRTTKTSTEVSSTPSLPNDEPLPRPPKGDPE